MYELLTDVKKNATFAMSSGNPSLPTGILLLKSFIISRELFKCVIFVSINPGAIVLHKIPLEPISIAISFIIPFKECLEDVYANLFFLEKVPYNEDIADNLLSLSISKLLIFFKI